MSDVEVMDADETDFWPDGTPVDLASITEWTEVSRALAVPKLDDGIVRGPDWVIAELDKLSVAAGQMVVVIKHAGVLKRARATELRKATARARQKHVRVKGSMHTALVNQEVEAERDAYDDAAIAEQYARDVAKIVESRQSSVQSMGKQIDLMYRDAMNTRRL